MALFPCTASSPFNCCCISRFHPTPHSPLPTPQSPLPTPHSLQRTCRDLFLSLCLRNHPRIVCVEEPVCRLPSSSPVPFGPAAAQTPILSPSFLSSLVFIIFFNSLSLPPTLLPVILTFLRIILCLLRSFFVFLLFCLLHLCPFPFLPSLPLSPPLVPPVPPHIPPPFPPPIVTIRFISLALSSFTSHLFLMFSFRGFHVCFSLCKTDLFPGVIIAMSEIDELPCLIGFIRIIGSNSVFKGSRILPAKYRP